ncbi:MAG: hypothetical protein HY722_10280 [Planctomycetes bacterium]|nr:hypothetical protein [Planctomycetota bacterium]
MGYRPGRWRRAAMQGALVALALGLTAGSAGLVGAAPRDEPRREPHFSHRGEFPRALVGLLLEARKSIDVAMYSMAVGSKRDDPEYASLRAAGEITVADALREAVERHVRVRVFLNKATTDVWNRKAVAPLLACGVDLYTCGRTMHEKFAVVDTRHVVNGSGNWSYGAFNFYDEDWVFFRDEPRLAKVFADEFRLLLEAGFRVTEAPAEKTK